MKIRILEILAALSIFIAILLIIVKGKAIKDRIPEILAVLSIFIAILLLIHQQLANDFWFNWDDFWHHEAVIACFVAAAIGLLVGKYLGRR